MEDDNEAPPISLFMSRRAKILPRKTTEELQAASELVERMQAENSTMFSIGKEFSPIKKSRRKEKKKGKSHPVDDLTLDDSQNIPDVKLSAASKKRLKKLQDEQALELELIEAENEKILSAMNVNSRNSVESVKETAEEFEKIAILTIYYMSKVSRIKCYENDKFLDIFPKVAKSLNLGVTGFLLCFGDKNITVDDTPKSLKLTDRDVLECIPYKADESSGIESEESGNLFKILFQSNVSRKKIEMLVHKIEKMQCIMKRYSDQQNIPLDQLLFDFDGDRLSGDETPADLDMEPGCCVDVTILVPTVKSTPKRSTRKRRKR